MAIASRNPGNANMMSINRMMNESSQPPQYPETMPMIVPAASIVGEAMVAITLCDAVLEKFGGDSMPEILDNLSRYRARTAARFTRV